MCLCVCALFWSVSAERLVQREVKNNSAILGGNFLDTFRNSIAAGAQGTGLPHPSGLTRTAFHWMCERGPARIGRLIQSFGQACLLIFSQIPGLPGRVMPSFEQDQLPVEPYTVFIDKPINASSLENGEESQEKPRYFESYPPTACTWRRASNVQVKQSPVSLKHV